MAESDLQGEVNRKEPMVGFEPTTLAGSDMDLLLTRGPQQTFDVRAWYRLGQISRRRISPTQIEALRKNRQRATLDSGTADGIDRAV